MPPVKIPNGEHIDTEARAGGPRTWWRQLGPFLFPKKDRGFDLSEANRAMYLHVRLHSSQNIA